MAKAAKAIVKTYDDAKMYRIGVNRVVAISEHMKVSPRHHDIKVRGSVLNSLPAEAIVSAEEV